MTSSDLDALKARLLARINVAPNGCWLWTGPKEGRSGFGLIIPRKGASNIKAHRASWMAHYGAIPERTFVRQTCGARHCVNPDHLYLTTEWPRQKGENHHEEVGRADHRNGSFWSRSL